MMNYSFTSMTYLLHHHLPGLLQTGPDQKNKPSNPTLKPHPTTSSNHYLPKITPFPTFFQSFSIGLTRAAHKKSTPLQILTNITKPFAIQILNQLQEPRAILRTVEAGEYKDKSLVIETILHVPNEQRSITDPSTLIDCGASGRGYISSNFVDQHNLPCTPLPYHIPSIMSTVP